MSTTICGFRVGAVASARLSSGLSPREFMGLDGCTLMAPWACALSASLFLYASFEWSIS